MIRELVYFGEKLRKENGDNEDSLTKERIDIIIVINNDGEFKSLYATDKESMVEDVIRCEDKGRTSSTVPRLLVDNAQYVLGFPKEKKRVRSCFTAFLDKLNQFQQLEELTPVLNFYKNKKVGLEKAYDAFKVKSVNKEINPGGNIAFVLLGEERFIHEHPSILKAIIKKYEKEEIEKKGEENTRCAICGDTKYRSKNISVHGVIKRVPDGQPSGCTLVSYNLKAFESYDLNGNDNATICTHCVKNYVTGLNWLLSHGNYVPVDTKGKKQKVKFKYSNRKNFGTDTSMVYWTRENTELGELDLLDKPDPEAVGRLVSSVATGKQDISRNFETNRFYSLTLSGAAARIAVRDWIEIGLDEYKKNIARWFEDIAIKAYGVIQYASIYQLADSCHKMSKSSKDNDPVISRVATYLWNAALKSDSIPPLWILTAVLKRIRVIEMTDDGRSRDTMTPVRASLIRLILNRNFKYKKGYTMQKEELDLENKNPSYLCGRIFAVMEGIQRAALGKNLNAGIRERFFSAASTNPSPAFGRLMRLSQNHLSKLKQEKPGVAVILDRELQYLCSAISAFPAILSLEEQGQFALGYYHQKQYDFDRAKKHEEFKSITENMED
ncbi:MAG TPA: type I-C CRISPR-associated protein Cas8c/Csd1 [Bacteroidetes bacterium]|nr:type I-C CRISPR-associated protein Cas8c/Csd1 [Bacteroidota bacterium]